MSEAVFRQDTFTFTGTFHESVVVFPERTTMEVINVFGLQDAKKGAFVDFEFGDTTVRYRITSWRKHGEAKRFYLKREELS